MSDLLRQLRRHEGVRSHAYKCSADMITVGVGRNIDPNGGIGLSDDEIDYLLKNDIERCRQELSTLSWFADLDPVRQDALINLCFNLGFTRLLGFKNAMSAMAVGDYDTAADEFLDSRWAIQVGMRAIEVTDMIRSGSC